MQTTIQDNTREHANSQPALVDERKSRLVVLTALVLVAAMFTFGAASWVGFMKMNGGPVGLFTQTDFPGVVIGARLISEGDGAELYNLDMQLREQQVLAAQGYLWLSPEENQKLKYPYPYPPFLAVLWAPFAGLSPLTDAAIYDLINIACMAGGLWLLLSSLPLSKTDRLLLLLAGITCFPFIENLEQGQSSGIIMLSLGGGIALLRRGSEMPAGLLLGLLIFKVQWLPLMALVLLWKRRWKALGGLTATTLAFLMLTLLAIGTGWIPGFLAITERAQHFAAELYLVPWFSQSITGALAALLGPGNDDLIGVLSKVALIIMAVLLLYMWRGSWRPGTARWDGLMSLTLLAMILTNLQLNTHDLSLVAIPAALGISFVNGILSVHSSRLAVYGVFWACYFLFWPPTLFTDPIRLTVVVMMLALGLILCLLIFGSSSSGREPVGG